MANLLAFLLYVVGVILAIAAWAAPVVFTLMAVKYMFF